MYIIIFLDMFERKLEDLKKLSRHILFLLCTASWCRDECQRKNGPHFSKRWSFFVAKMQESTW